MKKGICLLLVASIGACGGGTVPPTAAPADTTTPPSDQAVEIEVAPEFIQGTIPGGRLMLLVTLIGGEEAALSVAGEGAEVSVVPERIVAGEVAEVTLVASPTDEETEAAVTIAATAAGASSSEVTRTVTVLPWPDDRAEQAREILALFARWLEENRPELGVAEEIELTGSLTAPLLLVVSHYTFWSDEWEMGLSWHIMMPPDDFAELYLRPRGELAPTMAFRIGSWQTALETGEVDITEVAPPPEVVR